MSKEKTEKPKIKLTENQKNLGKLLKNGALSADDAKAQMRNLYETQDGRTMQAMTKLIEKGMAKKSGGVYSLTNAGTKIF